MNADPSQLIKELGFTAIASQGLTVAPYAVGWFMVFFQAWHSDRTRDRGYHIMLSTGTAVVGYIVLAALATANLIRSSEQEDGAAGRSWALALLQEAQASLESSISARWIDESLVQASWVRVLLALHRLSR